MDSEVVGGVTMFQDCPNPDFFPSATTLNNLWQPNPPSSLFHLTLPIFYVPLPIIPLSLALPFFLTNQFPTFPPPGPKPNLPFMIHPLPFW